jgi:transcription elongation factor Elf1
MAEKKARTAAKSRDAVVFKHVCPNCGAESKVTMFAGHGRRGFFLVCEKNCGYIARTR